MAQMPGCPNREVTYIKPSRLGGGFNVTLTCGHEMFIATPYASSIDKTVKCQSAPCYIPQVEMDYF